MSDKLTVALNLLDQALSWFIKGWVALIVLVALSQLAAPLFGHQMLIVAGRSMEPTIPFGAAAIVESNPARIDSDDIITYHTRNGTLITHRVVEVLDDGAFYRTAGDNNDEADARPAPAASVEGRLAFAVPGVGYLLALLASPLGLLSLLLAMAAFSLEALWRPEEASATPASDKRRAVA